MTSRRSITLTEAWNDHPVGEVLGVLEPGEDPGPGLVDAGRAAQLIADGKAGETKKPAAVKAPAKPGKRQSGGGRAKRG